MNAQRTEGPAYTEGAIIMQINPLAATAPTPKKPEPAREAFRQFVGEAVFGQMLSSMRKTVHKAPYFHGGRAEETFQGQLDQELAKNIAQTSADRFADPMFDLFMLQRS
jgi:Rod binding domain-containing protein